MHRRAAPFALLLLAGCDASPVVTSRVACQQRIIEARSAALLPNPAGSADIVGSFRDLATRYAEVSRKDCSEAQKKRLVQLETQASDLARLAADANKAGRSAAARNSRLPDSEANIAFMTALQAFEDRQAQLRRELREMQAR